MTKHPSLLPDSQAVASHRFRLDRTVPVTSRLQTGGLMHKIDITYCVP
jgi:hypothetical protein